MLQQKILNWTDRNKKHDNSYQVILLRNKELQDQYSEMQAKGDKFRAKKEKWKIEDEKLSKLGFTSKIAESI